jgi:hypothetical protein
MQCPFASPCALFLHKAASHSHAVELMSHNQATAPADIYLVVFELKDQNSGGQPEITQKEDKDTKLENTDRNNASNQKSWAITVKAEVSL